MTAAGDPLGVSVPTPDAQRVIADVLQKHRHRGFRVIDNGPHEDDVITYAVLCRCGEDFHAATSWQAADAHDAHVAEVIAALPGVAVIQLPEREGGRWPVDFDDDDFSVWRIWLRRESDGAHANGARISWGSMELNLGGDHARALAAALLAAAVLSEETTTEGVSGE